MFALSRGVSRHCVVPMAAAYTQEAPSTSCGMPSFVSTEDGHVQNLTVRGYPRCFTIIASESARRRRPALPVLFFFHGSGGSGAECGAIPDRHGHKLASLALEFDFALVCGEARWRNGSGGFLWHIPAVQTDASGTRCSDSEDEAYLVGIFSILPPFADRSKTSFVGSSLGAGFATFAATCIRRALGRRAVGAFATHATGLKVKGDGLDFPAIWHATDRTWRWGECPECQWFPIVPQPEPGLKACIFDGTADPTKENPFFYRSSLQLVHYWHAVGNPIDSSNNGSFVEGGKHDKIDRWLAMLRCLDASTDGGAHSLLHPRAKS